MFYKPEHHQNIDLQIFLSFLFFLTSRFRWKRTNSLLGRSKVTVEWYIPNDQPTGTYRIKHFGHYKVAFTGKIKSYSGTSKTFEVSSLILFSIRFNLVTKSVVTTAVAMAGGSDKSEDVEILRSDGLKIDLT